MAQHPTTWHAIAGIEPLQQRLRWQAGALRRQGRPRRWRAARGINALYAANIALAAINAQRETFSDDDTVRIHPILTRGGDLVNVIPNDVRLETMVRGKTAEAIDDAAMKVDRALKAGAMALGAEVEITTLPGYMPLVNNPAMAGMFKGNFLTMYGEDEWEQSGHRTGSTDMGDVSHIMPALHPYVSGFSRPATAATGRSTTSTRPTSCQPN